MARSLTFNSKRYCAGINASQFLFSLAVCAVVVSKFVHIYAHLGATSSSTWLLWGASFFAQDVAYITLLFFLTQRQGLLRFVSVVLSLYTFWLAVAIVSFFIVSGVEIQWRDIGAVADPAMRKVLLTGALCFVTVFGMLIAASWVAQGAAWAV